MEDARQSDGEAVTAGPDASDGPRWRVSLQEAGRWWPQGEHAGDGPTWVSDGTPAPGPSSSGLDAEASR